MPDILQLANVTAGYGATVILEDVSLSLRHGAALAVLGRNGMGKTTLMRTIAGHANRHHGRVLLEGQDVGAARPWRRARLGMGYVPQEREIFPSLSVLENLQICARPGPWDSARVYELFPSLKSRLANAGTQLSGGEQQMLAIARALMTNPSLLLMDEPTEGLAPVVVQALTRVLAKLRGEGKLAIVLVEQNSRVALDFCERTVVMDRGQIVYDGPADRLRRDPETLARLIAAQ